jgi:hypothetical protein
MAPSAERPAGRALAAGEIAVLAGYADRVRRAPDDDQRQIAQAAAVHAARHYRDRGAGWAGIARALGVSAAVLRDWRGDGAEAKPRPDPAGSADREAPGQAGQRITRRPGLRPMVYVALGSMQARGNDFAREAAAIRRVLRLMNIEVMERCAVEISELREEVGAMRPAIVHIAATSPSDQST